MAATVAAGEGFAVTTPLCVHEAAVELARVTCPIGIAGITGKEPEVIAVAVAAQLLQLRSAVADAGPRRDEA